MSQPRYLLGCFWACLLGEFVPIPKGIDLSYDRNSKLLNVCQCNYDVKLSASVTYNYPNIKEITNYLLSILFVENKKQNSSKY
ncbi:hypothetical protein [Hyella patelloides]|uniref:hypothetical protein n=1 Tax=Hyella patelloides TaxID=1982969 RepID=UPI0011A55571|nr:hypothetical protein [Hyella patelloides]